MQNILQHELLNSVTGGSVSYISGPSFPEQNPMPYPMPFPMPWELPGGNLLTSNKPLTSELKYQ